FNILGERKGSRWLARFMTQLLRRKHHPSILCLQEVPWVTDRVVSDHLPGIGESTEWKYVGIQHEAGVMWDSKMFDGERVTSHKGIKETEVAGKKIDDLTMIQDHAVAVLLKRCASSPPYYLLVVSYHGLY